MSHLHHIASPHPKATTPHCPIRPGRRARKRPVVGYARHKPLTSKYAEKRSSSDREKAENDRQRDHPPYTLLPHSPFEGAPS